MKKRGSKELKKYMGLILSVCVLTGCSETGHIDEDFETKAGNITQDVSSKVRFEGIRTIKGESSSEIAEAINNSDAEQTKLVIELDNEYSKYEERPDDDISIEEAQAIIKKQSAL